EVDGPATSPVAYTWDDNGSLTARGSDSFAWDYEERMTSATVNSVTTTFAYRGDGLRNSRTANSVTTTFTWDIGSGLPVVIDDGNRYVYGAGLEAMVDGADPYYYLADGLGSTMAIVDDTGTVQKSYTYDVYGGPTPTGALANEFDFAGQQTDPTGLQYLRARYMDPETGGFVSREPMAIFPAWTGTPHAYANSNPARMFDLTGLASVDSGNGGAGCCSNQAKPVVAPVAQTCSAPTTPTPSGSGPNCTDNTATGDPWGDPWAGARAFASLIGEYAAKAVRQMGENELAQIEAETRAYQAVFGSIRSCVRDLACNTSVGITLGAISLTVSLVALSPIAVPGIVIGVGITATIASIGWTFANYFEFRSDGGTGSTPTPTPAPPR
ncbi:MAG: RHS repeat-associated core domain-containing protein, partial [Dehalococcoidia bacterium]